MPVGPSTRLPGADLTSGGWKFDIVGVPWRGSVSACVAWGDVFVKHIFSEVLKRPSLLRHHGTPMIAQLQLPDYCTSSTIIIAIIYDYYFYQYYH